MQKISKLNEADIETCCGTSLDEMKKIVQILEEGNVQMGIISVLVKNLPKPLWSWPMPLNDIEKELEKYKKAIEENKMIHIKNTYVHPNMVITMRINLYKDESGR